MVFLVTVVVFVLLPILLLSFALIIQTPMVPPAKLIIDTITISGVATAQYGSGKSRRNQCCSSSTNGYKYVLGEMWEWGG